MKNELLEIFSIIFNKTFKENEVISKQSEENWDSLKHIELIMAIEEEFEITFNPEEIPELDSFDKILQKIEELK